MSYSKQIVEHYGEEYIYRQLAEEASELCHASLKTVRSIRHETPVTLKEAKAHALEEVADVEVMLYVLKTGVLGIQDNEEIARIYREKMDRMIDRMIEGEPLDSNGR